MSDKTIGVILSGAGHLDGTEIHEAVLCLLALDEAGVSVRAFAPDVTIDEVDHLTRKATGNKRGALAESARIARGEVGDLADVNGTDVDGWVLPGGGGVRQNLSDLAEAGVGASAHKEVTRVVREALAAQLPVGACCMAPALLAVVTKRSGPQLKLTIGEDEETAKVLRGLGAEHVMCRVGDVVTDEEHRVVTTPAYMAAGAQISDVSKGVARMVQQVVSWA
jgi:enhancing lycopene biosynthesis protein 2